VMSVGDPRVPSSPGIAGYCKAIFIVHILFREADGFLHLPMTSRTLVGDRLLACSRDHIMIYTFVTVEMENTALTGAPKSTEPLWKVPIPGQQECCGRLSPT
jgi:hypothetical protein